MKALIKGVAITCIANCVPAQFTELEDLAPEFGALEIKKIMRATGIRRVRTAPEGMCASDLCASAAQAALKAISPDRTQIDGIVFVSQTPDYLLPATSVSLQSRLGLSKECVALDINYGCSGFIYGLFVASILVSSGSCRKVLVCVGDTISRLIHPKDRSLRMVFGDAGSCAFVEANDGEIGFTIGSDGSGAAYLMVPSGGARYPRSDRSGVATERENNNIRSDEHLFMDGVEILNFALREVPEVIADVVKVAGWHPQRPGLFAFHQANRFIVEYLVRVMGLPQNSAPIDVEGTGNTGPSSIPLLLCSSAVQARPNDDLRRSVLCGFGVGLSWGAVAADLSNTILLPTVTL